MKVVSHYLRRLLNLKTVLLFWSVTKHDIKTSKIFGFTMFSNFSDHLTQATSRNIIKELIIRGPDSLGDPKIPQNGFHKRVILREKKLV